MTTTPAGGKDPLVARLQTQLSSLSMSREALETLVNETVASGATEECLLVCGFLIRKHGLAPRGPLPLPVRFGICKMDPRAEDVAALGTEAIQAASNTIVAYCLDAVRVEHFLTARPFVAAALRMRGSGLVQHKARELFRRLHGAALFGEEARAMIGRDVCAGTKLQYQLMAIYRIRDERVLDDFGRERGLAPAMADCILAGYSGTEIGAWLDSIRDEHVAAMAAQYILPRVDVADVAASAHLLLRLRAAEIDGASASFAVHELPLGHADESVRLRAFRLLVARHQREQEPQQQKAQQDAIVAFVREALLGPSSAFKQQFLVAFEPLLRKKSGHAFLLDRIYGPMVCLRSYEGVPFARLDLTLRLAQLAADHVAAPLDVPVDRDALMQCVRWSKFGAVRTLAFSLLARRQPETSERRQQAPASPADVASLVADLRTQPKSAWNEGAALVLCLVPDSASVMRQLERSFDAAWEENRRAGSILVNPCGTMMAVRMLMTQRGETTAIDSARVVELIDLAERIVSHPTPEGLELGAEESDTDEDASNNAAQVASSLSWRTVKEGAALLAALSPAAPGNAQLLSYLCGLALRLRHPGAFSNLLGPITAVARSASDAAYAVVESILEDRLQRFPEADTTRRSAGLPFLLRALLVSASAAETVLGRLVAMVPSACDVTRVHLFNCIRAILLDSRLGANVRAAVDAVLETLFVCGLPSSSWAVRNAASTLFSAVVGLVFGPPSAAVGSEKIRIDVDRLVAFDTEPVAFQVMSVLDRLPPSPAADGFALKWLGNANVHLRRKAAALLRRSADSTAAYAPRTMDELHGLTLWKTLPFEPRFHPAMLADCDLSRVDLGAISAFVYNHRSDLALDQARCALLPRVFALLGEDSWYVNGLQLAEPLWRYPRLARTALRLEGARIADRTIGEELFRQLTGPSPLDHELAVAFLDSARCTPEMADAVLRRAPLHEGIVRAALRRLDPDPGRLSFYLQEHQPEGLRLAAGAALRSSDSALVWQCLWDDSQELRDRATSLVADSGHPMSVARAILTMRRKHPRLALERPPSRAIDGAGVLFEAEERNLFLDPLWLELAQE